LVFVLDLVPAFVALVLVVVFVVFVVVVVVFVVSIFIAVSIAVGAGAGAMAGVVVSAAGVLSAFEQAATATIVAATRARRFMQFSCVELGTNHERCSKEVHAFGVLG
jgi:hypothetical protein